MKVRLSFVSNSSSSSYIVVAAAQHYTSIAEAVKHRPEGARVVCLGQWMDESRDEFVMDEDMITAALERCPCGPLYDGNNDVAYFMHAFCFVTTEQLDTHRLLMTVHDAIETALVSNVSDLVLRVDEVTDHHTASAGEFLHAYTERWR